MYNTKYELMNIVKKTSTGSAWGVAGVGKGVAARGWVTRGTVPRYC